MNWHYLIPSDGLESRERFEHGHQKKGEGNPHPRLEETLEHVRMHVTSLLG